MSYAVILYQHPNYGGIQWPLNSANISDLSTAGISDNSVSSIKIAPFTKVTMYSDKGFAGTNKVFVGPANIPDLNAVKDSSGDWNDRMSSIKVSQFDPTPEELAKCCSGTAAETDSVACGPYTPGSQACTSSLMRYCTGTDMLGTSVGPGHLDQPACQSWCKRNPEYCDAAVIAYCKGAGSGTPFCSCLNSPATTRGLINPKCVDIDCIAQGYLTANMAQSNCPDVVNCSVVADLSNSGVSLASSSPIVQNCGNNEGATNEEAELEDVTERTGGNGPSGVEAPGYSMFAPPMSIAGLITSPVYLFLAFVVLVFVVLVGYYAFAGDDTPAVKRATIPPIKRAITPPVKSATRTPFIPTARPALEQAPRPTVSFETRQPVKVAVR